MEMNLVNEILSAIAYATIVGCGVAVVKKILNVCNAKIDELQATTKLVEYDKLNLLIDQVQKVVTTVVQSVNQTFVSDLKKSGSFDKESALQAKDAALKMARDLMKKEAVVAIEEVYGNVDEYLELLVEKTVNELKK